jgi:hypothetical protein
MKKTYVVTLAHNSNFTDWGSILPDNTGFMVYVNFISKYLQVSTAIPHMVCYTDFLNSTTATTIGATVHPFATEYLCSPINNNYSSNREVLSTTISNRVPLYIPSRPTLNNYSIRFLESTSNNTYAASFYGMGFQVSLTFVPYIPKIPRHVSEKVVPFNVILNSANGTILNTKSSIQYKYNWLNHWNSNPNQQYKMSWFFQSMGMNVSTTQPLQISMSCLPVSNNFYVDSNTNGSENSNIIGSAYGYDYTTLSNYLGGPLTNPDISVILPTQNIFDIQLYELGTQTLFAPTAGSMEDYIIILHFDPVSVWGTFG